MPPWSPFSFRQGATLLSGIFAARYVSTSTSSGSVTSCSKRLVRPASPYAQRESPTPLIFLQTPGVDWKEAARRPRGHEDWRNWADMFAQKGYTSVEIDVDVRTERSSTPEFGSREPEVSIAFHSFPSWIGTETGEGGEKLKSLDEEADSPACG